MKPSIWWILAKIWSFLDLETFPKKKKPPKSLETTLTQRWFQNIKFETTVKPPWFHKKRPFSKISLKIVFWWLENFDIFQNSNPNIFENFWKKSEIEKKNQKFTKKSYGWSNYIKKSTIFCVLKSKSGPFLSFWKTPWDIAQFLICNFV